MIIYMVRKILCEGSDAVISVHYTKEGAERAIEGRAGNVDSYYVEEWYLEE
jgi:hypothetical protein